MPHPVVGLEGPDWFEKKKRGDRGQRPEIPPPVVGLEGPDWFE